MKKVIASISTDWHLELSNVEIIRQCVREQCINAKENGLD